MAKPTRLKKAPLTEVVFELRWELQPGPTSEPILRSDPGLLPLIDAFTALAKKKKFGTSTELSHPAQTGAYGVVRRFYQGAAKPFPILQIGPGIFASNDGPNYDWSPYKKQTLEGVRMVLDSYPKLSFLPFKPLQLEVRYIDLFNKSVLGNTGLFGFTENSTTLKFKLPPMLEDSKIFSGSAVGRFVFNRDLKKWKGSKFVLDLTSARHNETQQDVVKMETKVISQGHGVPTLSTPAKFIGEVDRWLEFAHDTLSPFFKGFVDSALMKKFDGK